MEQFFLEQGSFSSRELTLTEQDLHLHQATTDVFFRNMLADRKFEREALVEGLVIDIIHHEKILERPRFGQEQGPDALGMPPHLDGGMRMKRSDFVGEENVDGVIFPLNDACFIQFLPRLDLSAACDRLDIRFQTFYLKILAHDSGHFSIRSREAGDAYQLHLKASAELAAWLVSEQARLLQEETDAELERQAFRRALLEACRRSGGESVSAKDIADWPEAERYGLSLKIPEVKQADRSFRFVQQDDQRVYVFLFDESSIPTEVREFNAL